MAVTTDDLSAPLGQKSARKRRFRLPFTGTQAIAVVLGLVLTAFIGFALFNDNPLGGEPVARVALGPTKSSSGEKAAEGHGEPAKEAKSATEAAKQPPAGQKTITIIDGSSGARHDVVVAGDGAEKVEADAAPAVMGGINQ